MKRILLALAMVGLFLPAARQADAADVSIDFFYNNLGDSGQWLDVADYGYCWQPSVAASNQSWRPYSDGYWSYTDVGWTWVSYEDFGWATYHYGRWSRLQDYGWVWVPGYEWGPAWVSWRTGGDYVGWAPLPPRRGEVVYEGRPITGSVDVEFDIGPMYYNFVDVRYIGEPVLRDRIYEPSRNVTFVQNTVNVTNITYNNSQVYNYGPDYNTLSSYSARPIQRLRLERQGAVSPTVGAAQSTAFTKVQGDKLVVAAPQKLERPSRQVAPKVVKTRIAQPKIETGWMGMNDPKAQAELRQKMKTENPKNVPPPTAQPANAVSAGKANAATPATPASPATGGAPVTAASPATPAAPAVPAVGRGKNKGRRDAVPPVATPAHDVSTGTGAPPAQAAPPANAPVMAPKGKARRDMQPAMTPPVAATPAAETSGNPAAVQPTASDTQVPRGRKEQGRKEPARRLDQQPGAMQSAPAQSANPASAAPVAPQANEPQKKHKGEARNPEAAPTQGSAVPPQAGVPQGAVPSQPARAERRRPEPPPQARAAEPQGGQPPQSGQRQSPDERQKGKGKKKPAEEQPAAPPQG